MATNPDTLMSGSAGLREALPKLRGMWRWWLGELSAMLPTVLRPETEFLSGAWFIQLDNHQVQLLRHAEGKLKAVDKLDLAEQPAAEHAMAIKSWLARIVPAQSRLVLLVNPAQVLLKTISLPQAAEENLRQVLAFELDRHTPFLVDDAYFDYRVVRRVLGEADIGVQLAAAPKNRIDASLDLLAKAGLQPVAVVSAGDLDAGRMPLDLLPPERHPRPTTRLGNIYTALSALTVALCVAAVALPLWQKHQAVARLTPKVEQAKRSAQAVEAIREEVDQLVGDYNFLLERKRAYPASVLVLEDLSRRLPDGTWLQQLGLRSHPQGWEIQMQGETTVSAKLVGLVDASPLLAEAAFKSPLTKGQTPGSERFDLQAAVQPLSSAANTAPAQPSVPAAPAQAPRKEVTKL